LFMAIVTPVAGTYNSLEVANQQGLRESQ